MTTPAVFLDRDGTLVRDVRHTADPSRLEVLAGVADALLVLQGAGYRLVVVTNQSGVARGEFSLAEAEAMGEVLRERLASLGVLIDAYYLCPHHPGGKVAAYAHLCACRKPAPGLVALAAEAEGLDLGRSWIVGDSLSDAQAGVAAGTRAILVDIGRPDVGGPLPAGVLVARNLPHAAAVILGRADPSPTGPLTARTTMADRREAGEPSPWPDAAWEVTARREAEFLCADKRILAAESASL